MPGPTFISGLPLADPLDGTEDVPVVQHGITKQSKSSDFWSGGTLVTLAISGSDPVPLVDGTAAVGALTKAAREDHVHPTDTSRAPLASPSFTGTPIAPTATGGTNNTQLATTAFVQTALSGYSTVSLAVGGTDPAPVVDGTAAVGISTKAAREDHVHPTDTSRLAVTTAATTYAPLASPTLTGVPAGPTAVAGTNTTQLATTAYVVTALSPYLTTSTASSTYAPLASPTFTGTIGGTADFSAVLSKATGSSTNRTLAVRFSDVINVLDWGAVADCTGIASGTNNTTAFQNALAYAKAQGKSLYIPAGKYRMVGALAIDVSAYTSIIASPPLPSIVGDGSRATILVWDNGVTTGLSVTGSWTGTETIGSFSISGLCLYKGDGAGTGLALNTLVHAHVSDVISLQWGYGCLCSDVLSSEFDNCQFMYNLQGLEADRGTQSEPNAISFVGCQFGGNQNWGLSVRGSSTLTVTGGSIENNGGVGVSANQFGVQVVASATDPQEGSAAATFNSVYFERNAGFGDIYFANSAWNRTLTVVGCTFNRGDPMSTGALGTNCIRLEVFGASAVTRVSLVGNGFKGLGTYTASSARPYIGIVNAGQPLFIYDVGCHYDSSLEAPTGGTLSGFAPLASPTFTGTPAAPTATSGTNTTQIATTAFVQTALSGYSTVTLAVGGTDPVPVINGTAAVGTATKAAREDHVHPTDSSRAPLASPTFTGTVTIPAGASISGFAPVASPTFTGVPAAPTAAAATNTTQIATTAFVQTAVTGTVSLAVAGTDPVPLIDGTAAVGTATKAAREDHVHPTDSTRAPLASPTFTGTVTIPAGASISGFAPLASPTFTGTPAAPTAVAGTNTTQLSTTAYVVSALTSYLTSAAASSTYEAIASLAADVRAVVLTGLSTATSTAITTADSILSALGKLQAQVTLRAPLASPSFTGTIGGTADFSAALTKPTGTGTATRSFATRFADEIKFDDYVQVGDTSASDALARIISTVSGNLNIYLLPKTYTFASAVTHSGNRSISLIGAGSGFTTIQFNASGTFLTCPMADLSYGVVLQGIRVLAATGGSAAVANISYPTASSSAYPGPVLRDVNIVSPAGAAWHTGFILTGCWSTRATAIQMIGAGGSPATTGTSLFQVGTCYDLYANDCVAFYVDALVYQVEYIEGIHLNQCSTIGTNYTVKQAATGITLNGIYSGVGLWMTGCENNTQLGGLALTNWKGGTLSANDWSQWAGVTVGTNYAAYSLTDCVNLSASADDFVGNGANTSVCVAVKLRFSANSCSSNTWMGSTFEAGVGVAVDFGASTVQNAVLDGSKQPSQVYSDLGTGNRITWRTAGGALASTEAHVFASGSDQTLMTIQNVGNAVNSLAVAASPTGVAPTVLAQGTDTNVGITLLAKGVGGLTASHGGGTLYVAAPGSTTTVNYLTIQSQVTGTSPVLIPTGSDTSIGVTVALKADGVAAITSTSTTSLSTVSVSATSNANGASIKFLGNGGTTPNKTIRVTGGQIQVVNSGYTVAILALDDAGNLSVTGKLSAGGGLGVFGVTAPGSRPAVTGSRSANAALASLLTALAATGLITDSTTV